MWHTAMIEKFLATKGITGQEAADAKDMAKKFAKNDGMFAGANLSKVLGEKRAEEFMAEWNKDPSPYLKAARDADLARVGKPKRH